MGPSSDETAAYIAPAEQAVGTISEPNKEFDYARLLHQITQCNEQELTYFEEHWADIHEQLTRAVAAGKLTDLPTHNEETLWTALGYLQGWRHPSVYHKHGNEMLKVLRTFGTKEQLSSQIAGSRPFAATLEQQ